MNEWRSQDTVNEYITKTTDPVVGWYEYEVNFPDLERLIPKDAQSLLDFGCGAADFTRKLSEKFEMVIGTDIEPMISVARNMCPGLTLIEWDGISELPRELGTYDVIFSKLVFQFIEDLDQVAFNLRKALNDQGSLIFSVPHPTKISKKFGLNPDAVVKYDDEVGKTGIKIHPIYRSQEKYMEIFANAGFKISEISEPLVPIDILQKHNVSSEYNRGSNRLNVRLIAT